jgi:exosortase A-associated hydrolase 1
MSRANGGQVGMAERFIVFECGDDACVGVVSPSSDEASDAPRLGMVIVVGGPQYRVGSHRQFTLLARAVAGAGFPVLRFDYRGMGDSEGAARDFERIDDDIAAAIEALQREAGVARVVLWGLCDGASAALMYAPRDSRVAGVIAANPWARCGEVEATTRLRHYYARRMLSREFWHKALHGALGVKRSARELAATLRAASRKSAAVAPTFLQRMQDGWSGFRGPVLLVLSGRDYTAREFETWSRADARRERLLERSSCETFHLDDADHTFSARTSHEAVARRTIEWTRQLAAR